MLLVCGGLLFVMLLLFVAAKRLESLPGSWSPVAVGVAMACQVAGIAALVVHMAGSMSMLVVWGPYVARMQENELVRDVEQAMGLAPFPVEAIEVVDHWLERKVARIERHVAWFFGSPTVALTGLIGMGWAAGKELSGVSVQGDAFEALVFALAIFVGFAFGALMLGRDVRRMVYQRDLVQLFFRITGRAG